MTWFEIIKNSKHEIKTALEGIIKKNFGYRKSYKFLEPEQKYLVEAFLFGEGNVTGRIKLMNLASEQQTTLQESKVINGISLLGLKKYLERKKINYKFPLEGLNIDEFIMSLWGSTDLVAETNHYEFGHSSSFIRIFVVINPFENKNYVGLEINHSGLIGFEASWHGVSVDKVENILKTYLSNIKGSAIKYEVSYKYGVRIKNINWKDSGFPRLFTTFWRRKDIVSRIGKEKYYMIGSGYKDLEDTISSIKNDTKYERDKFIEMIKVKRDEKGLEVYGLV